MTHDLEPTVVPPAPGRVLARQLAHEISMEEAEAIAGGLPRGPGCTSTRSGPYLDYDDVYCHG